MTKSVWGDRETQYFFELTPERVLEAVEAAGLRTTGRACALNSMENRVYDVELDLENVKYKVERERVVKFYRPGRWTREQILEEHEFLRDLAAEDIPVIAPLEFPDGKTLRQDETSGIWYALFPKMGGRAPDELDTEQLRWIARTLARMHSVGKGKPSRHRLQLSPDTYGLANLDFILDNQLLPMELENRYQDVVEAICDFTAPWFAESPVQRIHGDCHLGNFLWRPDTGPLLLDFDDMVRGPPVQDFWLLIPGRDQEAKRKWSLFLDAYEEMQDFDRRTLRLVEPLRALRFVHFNAWIGKRWQDPAFQNAFPYYGTFQYWQKETADLEEELDWIQRIAQEGGYFETF